MTLIREFFSSGTFLSIAFWLAACRGNGMTWAEIFEFHAIAIPTIALFGAILYSMSEYRRKNHDSLD